MDDDGQRRCQAGHRPQPLALEKQKQWLLDRVAAKPEVTLEEIRARLRSEKKQKAGIASIWRFYDRLDITFKKKLCMPPSRIVLMLPPSALRSKPSEPSSMRRASSSSTRR